MVHMLLVLSLALFVLWIIGIAGAWAAPTAWTLFAIACVLFLAWLVVGFAGGFGGRRTT
jgi:hypothetical protein